MKEERFKSFRTMGSGAPERLWGSLRRGTRPSLRPGRDQSSLLCGSAVALTISKYLATTKLKWLCTSVSHDVLDSYRKQDRRKQEHSHGAQLQITILANIKGCIPLWVDASTTWSKCCVFLRIKATPVQVKTTAEWQVRIRVTCTWRKTEY